MTEIRQLARTALDEARRSVAEDLVAAQFRRQPQLEQRYGAQGRAKCLQDAEYHLGFLTQAVATDEPKLFSEYVRWVRSMLHSRGVPAEDLDAHLRAMREILRRHLAPEAYALADRCMDQGLAELGGPLDRSESLLAAAGETGELARDYLDRLLRADRHDASRLVLAAVDGGIPLRDIYLEVFQPVQREVGRLWQTNRISVAEEHYCSAATQLVMSQLYPKVFGSGGRHPAGRLVAVSVAGELHEIGVRMVADILEMEGWATCYLGANTPPDDVVRSLIDRQAQIACISTTMTFNLPAAETLIAAIRASTACAGVKILVGGYPFNLAPGLWRKLGADACASDAAEAAAVARRLVTDGRH